LRHLRRGSERSRTDREGGGGEEERKEEGGREEGEDI